jgi:hypothetical protein
MSGFLFWRQVFLFLWRFSRIEKNLQKQGFGVAFAVYHC